jgi:predicted aconitase with swiveling domain
VFHWFYPFHGWCAFQFHFSASMSASEPVTMITINEERILFVSVIFSSTPLVQLTASRISGGRTREHIRVDDRASQPRDG